MLQAKGPFSTQFLTPHKLTEDKPYCNYNASDIKNRNVFEVGNQPHKTKQQILLDTKQSQKISNKSYNDVKISRFPNFNNENKQNSQEATTNPNTQPFIYSNKQTQCNIQAQKFGKSKSIRLKNQQNNNPQRCVQKGNQKTSKSKNKKESDSKTKEQKQATKELLQHYHAESLIEESYRQNKNQSLEGWISKNGSKKYFTENDQRLLYSIQQCPKNYQINQSNLLCNHSEIQNENLLRNIPSKSQKNKIKFTYFHQITTNQFLKDLKLKYVKATKQKQKYQNQDLKRSKTDFNHSLNENIIKIEDHDHQNCDKNQSNQDEHQKKKEKKTLLSLKTIIPNANRRKKNINNKNNRKNNQKIQQQFQERINHDCLKSRTNSRCQSALKSSRLKTQKKTGQDVFFQQKQKNKLLKHHRNKTIDSSELQSKNNNIGPQTCSYGTKSKYPIDSHQKLKQKLKNEENIINLQQVNKIERNDSNKINKEIQPQIGTYFQKQNKKVMKMKLKYFHNPISTRISNLNTIERQIMKQSKNDKLNYSIFDQRHLIQSSARIKERIIPWEVRMSQRGGEQFHKLRKLLIKQEQSYIYFPCESEMKRKYESDHKIYLQSRINTII